MAESNFVLFKRHEEDQESHEDIWDDTALIQAYDRSIKLAKEKVAAQLGLGEEPEATTSSEPGPSSRSEMSSPSKSPKKQKWRVGDFVRSVYSEDGVVYEATIKKIDISAATCVVKYLGYGNEEEVLLKDLEPSLGIAARNKQIALSADSSDEMECEVPSQSPARPPPNTGLHWQPVEPEPFPSFPGMDHVPSIPPPPPPSAWPSHGSEQIDADSLYSMLMSWYMAGYHTGYYQGVQQRNKRKGVFGGT